MAVADAKAQECAGFNMCQPGLDDLAMLGIGRPALPADGPGPETSLKHLKLSAWNVGVASRLWERLDIAKVYLATWNSHQGDLTRCG